MSTKHERMLEQIEHHGENLGVIFPDAKKHGYKLCAALRRLELAATRETVNLCNVPDYQDTADAAIDAIEARVIALLGITPGRAVEIGLHINRDPRGYALKLSSEWTEGYRRAGGMIHCDMGGYGILAPEFDGK